MCLHIRLFSFRHAYIRIRDHFFPKLCGGFRALIANRRRTFRRNAYTREIQTGWRQRVGTCRVMLYVSFFPKVHFLEWAPAFDSTIGRLSSNIQPLHTFTTAWRALLNKGSIVEARRKVDINNQKTDDDDDGDGKDDVADDTWEICVVLALGKMNTASDCCK